MGRGLTYRLIVSHEEAIARDHMGIKCGPEALINSLVEGALKLTEPRLVDGFFVDVVCSDTS